MILSLNPISGIAQESSSMKQGISTPEQLSLERKIRDIELGQTYDQVIQILQKDALVQIDRNSEFYDFQEHPNFIKASIQGVFTSIYYEFKDSKLFGINIILDPKTAFFNRLYRKLKAKYGEPSIFNPQYSVWEDQNTKISLDQKSIRYLDTKILDEIKKEKKSNTLTEISQNEIEALLDTL